MTVRHPRLPTRQPSLCPTLHAAARDRRLSDKVRVAVHAACDEGDVEIAERLLGRLDTLIHHPPVLPTGIDRRRPESLTALCERLANLLLWRTQTGWGGQPPDFVDSEPGPHLPPRF